MNDFWLFRVELNTSAVPTEVALIQNAYLFHLEKLLPGLLRGLVVVEVRSPLVLLYLLILFFILLLLS